MRKLALSALPALFLASGCASVVTGQDQVVHIETYPKVNAHCLVSNERGSWTAYQTPQHVPLYRGHGPLSVSCKSYDGQWHGHAMVDSEVDPVAVAGAVATGAAAVGIGNAATTLGVASQLALTSGGANAAAAVLGGGAVDAYSGAAFKYDRHIVVRMEKAAH